MRKAMWLGSAFIVMSGMVLFSQLSRRPMHSDEGVNAWFFEKLYEKNSYRYDPKNYHGPSLYYLQWPVTWLSPNGITPVSIRTGVVMAGLLLLVGLLFAHRRIGPWGALTALVLMGTSAGFIFYSRYFIHEIHLILFTLGLYLAAVYLRDTKRPVYFYAGCVSAALLYATKETSILILATLVLSALAAKWVARPRDAIEWPPLKYHGLDGILLGLVVWGLLYSSFFTHPQGLLDSVRTYLTWTKTGVDSGHEKRFLYFVEDILLPYESPLVFLSVVGAFVALAYRNKSGLFLMFWTTGIFLIHSLIPYKTPWLALNMLLPMSLLAGYGIQTLLDRTATNRRRVLTLTPLLAITGALLIRQLPKTHQMVFVDYDNESYPYVYVHTSRDVYRLVDDINWITAKSGIGKEIAINVVSWAEWPLPFYLRDYPNIKFWQKYDNIPNLKSPLLIAETAQHDGLAEKLKGTGYITRPYLLRRSISLELWVRKDLAVE